MPSSASLLQFEQEMLKKFRFGLVELLWCWSLFPVSVPVRNPAVASPDHAGPRPLHPAQLPGNRPPPSDQHIRPQTVLRWIFSPVFSSFIPQGAVSSSLTCLQLHKRAERVAALLMERGGLQEGDHVALVYPPGQTWFTGLVQLRLKRLIGLVAINQLVK